jgi:hypothetical protein
LGINRRCSQPKKLESYFAFVKVPQHKIHLQRIKKLLLPRGAIATS